MGTIGSINISLEIFGSLISFIIILCLAISENRHTRLNRLYLRVVICNIAVMLCDALAIALKGGMDPVNYYGVRIANFCAFCLDYVIVALFADYLEAFIATKTKPSPRPFRIVRAICAAGILLVVISQWNHMYYRIDENNMYVRGDWFWLSQAVGLLCAAVYLCIIFRYRKHMKRKEFYLFLLYIMAPGIAAVVQTWIYGIALLYIATTLFVPGTDVDYPLVADEGNYYLTHDVYGGESVYGAIYLDESNKGDLQQPHLIIYDHNMKDGSMFAGLHKFEDKAFFDENRLVKIYTPEGRLDFEIFAAHARDDAYIPAVYGTEDKDGIARYLGEIAGTTDEKANLRMEGVTDEDAILTLSTCVRGEDEQRYVVEARYMGSRAG